MLVLMVVTFCGGGGVSVLFGGVGVGDGSSIDVGGGVGAGAGMPAAYPTEAGTLDLISLFAPREA